MAAYMFILRTLMDVYRGDDSMSDLVNIKQCPLLSSFGICTYDFSYALFLRVNIIIKYFYGCRAAMSMFPG